MTAKSLQLFMTSLLPVFLVSWISYSPLPHILSCFSLWISWRIHEVSQEHHIWHRHAIKLCALRCLDALQPVPLLVISWISQHGLLKFFLPLWYSAQMQYQHLVSMFCSLLISLLFALLLVCSIISSSGCTWKRDPVSRTPSFFLLWWTWKSLDLTQYRIYSCWEKQFSIMAGKSILNACG